MAKSEASSALDDARSALEEARAARIEAENAHAQVKALETKLQKSEEKNLSLVDELKATKVRTEAALRVARLAEKNALAAQASLVKESAKEESAGAIDEGQAIVEHLERDRLKAEEQYAAALEAQKQAAESRESLILGVFGAFSILLALLIFIILRGYLKLKSSGFGQSVNSLSGAANNFNTDSDQEAGLEPDGEFGKTVVHRDKLAEYVLDGRDEDGIRYLLRISGDQLAQSDGVIIGRNPKESPYIINHADVSRKHARLKVMKDRVFIEDLGSTNGTSVNGQTIDEKGPVSVSSGDQIIIGSVVMRLKVLDN